VTKFGFVQTKQCRFAPFSSLVGSLVDIFFLNGRAADRNKIFLFGLNVVVCFFFPSFFLSPVRNKGQQH
jgi:hypothetical protein